MDIRLKNMDMYGEMLDIRKVKKPSSQIKNLPRSGFPVTYIRGNTIGHSSIVKQGKWPDKRFLLEYSIWLKSGACYWPFTVFHDGQNGQISTREERNIISEL